MPCAIGHGDLALLAVAPLDVQPIAAAQFQPFGSHLTWCHASLSPLFQFAQHRQQPVDFRPRVIVQQAQPDEPRWFQPQRFGQFQRVEVSVPGEDLVLGQIIGQFDRT